MDHTPNKGNLAKLSKGTEKPPRGHKDKKSSLNHCNGYGHAVRTTAIRHR